MVSTGLFMGNPSPPTGKAYASNAMIWLLVAQGLYLMWDFCVMWWAKKGNNEKLKKKIKAEFLLGDFVGAVAAVLVFVMVFEMPAVSIQSVAPSAISTLASSPWWSNPGTLMFFGGIGAILYLIVTLFGPGIQDGSVCLSRKGGVIGYLSHPHSAGPGGLVCDFSESPQGEKGRWR